MPGSRQYLFGNFRLNSAERTLCRDGDILPLTPKALDTLLYLVERHGHVIGKTELIEAVWPGTFVEENSLARNISTLRKVLSESRDEVSFIETIPKRGYRFSAPVVVTDDAWAKGSVDNGITEALPASTISVDPWSGMLPTARPRRVGRGFQLSVTIFVALAMVTLLIGMAKTRAPGLRVGRTVQITSFGQVADPIATDGKRIFMAVREGGYRALAETSIARATGPDAHPMPIPTLLANPYIYDISPDGSELLIASSPEASADDERPLWILGAIGGAPQRLGNLSACGAAWSPRGDKIAFTRGSGLYVAGRDGGAVEKLADVAGKAEWPRWSPDGKVIRLTVLDPKTDAASLWEISASGSSERPLFRDFVRSEDRWGAGVANGIWTKDGRYFFFIVRRFDQENTTSVWAVEEKKDLFGRQPTPQQIFVSPLALGPPILSEDGQRLFLTVTDKDRQLMRYDGKRKQFLSWLGGISVMSATYSPGGAWVAYVTVLERDGTLWAARADGTSPVPLTRFPIDPFSPVFSPDGKQIAFFDGRAPRSRRICIVPRDGGAVIPLTTGDDISPSWFPDGHSILYEHLNGSDEKSQYPSGLYRLDLRTSERAVLPNSEGKSDAILSPDGKSILALSEDLRSLTVYDFKTQRWRNLATGSFLRSPCWSSDSRFVYFQDFYEGTAQPIYRVRVGGGRPEKVVTAADLQHFQGFHGYLFHGLSPDGRPIVSLLRNNSDVYALELNHDGPIGPFN